MSEIYTDPPQSRNEAIIKATIDGTEYTAPPQSRMEDLLLELKEVIEQGGGGGTSDYSQLSNKPSINDVTLSGNKTSADLGLMDHYDIDEAPTESSENLITSGAVWEADKNIENKLQGSKTVTGNPITITDAEPMNAESVVVELEPKQDLHGYDAPWVGGAGKNKLPLTVDGIKSANTDGTWTGDTYTINGVEIEIESDNGGNVVGISTTGTATSDIYFMVAVITENGTFKMLGCPSSGDFDTTYAVYQQRNPGGAIAYDSGQGTEIEARVDDDIRIVLRSGAVVDNVLFKPMITTDTLATYDDFAPYSNICPITGYSEVNVENNSNTYTIDLDGTKYGGTLDVTEGGYSDAYVLAGLGARTWSGTYNAYYYTYIGANYSEVLMSDAFEISTEYEVTQGHSKKNIVAYNSTTGNLMVYAPDYSDATEFRSAVSAYNVILKHKTPSSVSTTPTDIALLENTNNISTDGTNIQLKYQPNNVIGECKKFTVDEIAKLGLPQPPTIDGTYHLECSVSSGIPTITWVSNS